MGTEGKASSVGADLESSRFSQAVSRIIQLTIPCADDGDVFTQTERLHLIQDILSDTPYECWADQPLAKIYRHANYQPHKPVILVSSHIDSLYGEYYAVVKGGELHGTFDNSVCNALVVESMLESRLPAQVIVTFTGDEEESCRGVDQTIDFLREQDIFVQLEMVITLDLTEDHYGAAPFTVENYCVEQGNSRSRSLLRFGRKKDLKEYLLAMVAPIAFVKDAAPDESWQYDEYDLNCFSLCLPCRVLGVDMHDDLGVAVPRVSLGKYRAILEQIAQAVCNDLEQKGQRRGALGR